jgi:hypothetical protein
LIAPESSETVNSGAFVDSGIRPGALPLDPAKDKSLEPIS